MGVEIDVAYKKWVKEPEILYRPIMRNKYKLELDGYLKIHETYEEIGCYTTIDKNLFEPGFNNKLFMMYLDFSKEFINKIKAMNNINTDLKEWFINQDNSMLIYDIDNNCFHSAIDIEEYIVNRWHGYDEIEFDECGKSLYAAIYNTNHMYNLDLFPALISAEELYYYKEDKDRKIDENEVQMI